MFQNIFTVHEISVHEIGAINTGGVGAVVSSMMLAVYTCDGLATLSKNTTATFFTSSQDVNETRISTQVKEIFHVTRPLIQAPLIVYVHVLDVVNLMYTHVLLVLLHDKKLIDPVAVEDKA